MQSWDLGSGLGMGSAGGGGGAPGISESSACANHFLVGWRGGKWKMGIADLTKENPRKDSVNCMNPGCG
jgi:hypothetical protein